MQHPEEAVQGLVNPFAQCDTQFDLAGESMLHLAEYGACAGEGKNHQPEIAKNIAPLLDAGSRLSDGDNCQDLGEAFHTIRGRWIGKDSVSSVNDTDQDELDGTLVPFEAS